MSLAVSAAWVSPGWVQAKGHSMLPPAGVTVESGSDELAGGGRGVQGILSGGMGEIFQVSRLNNKNWWIIATPSPRKEDTNAGKYRQNNTNEVTKMENCRKKWI